MNPWTLLQILKRHFASICGVLLCYKMLQKEKEKEEARREKERYDRKIEQEAQNYNPWGRGGGGAPMKDIHGNLVCK